MADNYAIIGLAKLKTAGNIQGVLGHMTRSRRTANANGRENDILIQPPPLASIMERINGYLPRKNAVLSYDFLMTASPEAFKNMSEAEIKEWEQDSLEWCRRTFGRDNVIAAITHRDEQTPHIQAIVIPEWEGKLNASHFTDGRQKMRDLWTSYAAAMAKYGLKRGKLFSPAEHKAIKEYYNDVNRAAELPKKRRFKPEDLPEPGLKDYVNPKEYAAELINIAIKRYQQQNANLRTGLNGEKREKEKLLELTAKEKQAAAFLKANPEAFRNLEKELNRERQDRNADKKRMVKLMEAVKDFFKRNIDPYSILRTPERLGQLLDFPEIEEEIRLDTRPEKKTPKGVGLSR